MSHLAVETGETNINADDTSNKRQENSFTNTGAGGLSPNRPGNLLVSKYTTGEVRNIGQNRDWKKGDRIIEPQGLYQMENGELLLSRECSD